MPASKPIRSLIHEFRADGPRASWSSATPLGTAGRATRIASRSRRHGPDFVLRSATEAFVLTAGQTVEIPVAVERTNGFSQEIEVRADGLPRALSASRPFRVPRAIPPRASS